MENNKRVPTFEEFSELKGENLIEYLKGLTSGKSYRLDNIKTNIMTAKLVQNKYDDLPDKDVVKDMDLSQMLKYFGINEGVL